MTFASDRLADWTTARHVGDRVAGGGPSLHPVDRARLREDFAEIVPRAEELVRDHTGLELGGYPSRPWVMSRGEWLRANLRAFHRVLEPVALKVTSQRQDNALTEVRRKFLGAEMGGLVGYMGRRVLGQYDLFLPPDDDGLVYFVGPNIAGLERRHSFPERDFRMWLALHEVTHRLQFGGVPWLRGHITGMMDSYLSTLDMDVRRLVELVRRATEEVRAGEVEWRGFGWVFLLMTPDQRQMFRHMQALMMLLEGHGTFVMNQIGQGRIDRIEAFRRTLRERRKSGPAERAFQRAIGFDVKVRQYDAGERFVAMVVGEVGMERFNRVWEDPSNVPTVEEIERPNAWISRVGAA